MSVFDHPTESPVCTLSIFAGTWNLGNRAPPAAAHVLSEFIPPGQHDIYVIGVQEAKYTAQDDWNSARDDWLGYVANAVCLAKALWKPCISENREPGVVAKQCRAVTLATGREGPVSAVHSGCIRVSCSRFPVTCAVLRLSVYLSVHATGTCTAIWARTTAWSNTTPSGPFALLYLSPRRIVTGCRV